MNTSDDLDPTELFQEELLEYLSEYEIFLEITLKPRTIDRHYSIISAFIEYICLYDGVEGFEQIKAGMGGSKFCRYYNQHWDEALQTKTVKNTLYRYFFSSTKLMGFIMKSS